MNDNAFDPYAVLDVPATASQDQITHAYRRKLRSLHPDTRGATGENDAAADEELRRIMAAYALLRDRARRASFDRRVDARVSAGSTQGSSHSGPVRIPVRYGRQRWK